MFSAVARRSVTVARAATVRFPSQATQAAALQLSRQARASFSDKVGDGIPEINDTGREKEEREVAGFNRDPIYPPKGSGTKAMPFEVPSQHKERVVGFEHPISHAVYWFPMTAGKLHYVEEIDRYFKLVPLS
ncbi:unnamed protein product [Ascophyllum nodosum]